MVCGGRTRLLGLGARCGQLRLRALLSRPPSASRCLSGPPPASSRRGLPLVAATPVMARVVAVTALPGPSPWPPRRSMASNSGKQSLAEGVLKAKEAEAEQARRRTEGEGDKEGGEDKKGYKPLSKWQRRGYLFFAVTMVGGLVSNAVLFGENLN